MSISGRPELSPNKFMDRIVHGTVVGIDEEQGYVNVQFDGLSYDTNYCTIPLLWASFPGTGLGSAWGRYIPHINALLIPIPSLTPYLS